MAVIAAFTFGVHKAAIAQPTVYSAPRYLLKRIRNGGL